MQVRVRAKKKEKKSRRILRESSGGE